MRHGVDAPAGEHWALHSSGNRDFAMTAWDERKSSISAIVPVRNAAGFLAETLEPLRRLLREGELTELIVVDDGSTDSSQSIASSHGARLLATAGAEGPAAARNLASQTAAGDILWFVDADVIAPLDAVARLRDAFAEDDVVAAFGSYDDCPRAPNFLSQYKNLAHHFYHQRGDREANTFWAGCGAVRAEAFNAVGGFDAARFDRPSIEDIDLGYRLRDQGGRIRLLPALQATHLKEWRLRNLVLTDIFRRAVPWTRLLMERGGAGDELNVARSERLRAALAILCCIALGAIVSGLLPWWGVSGVVLVILVANAGFVAFFRRRRGFAFALAAVLFQQFYYLYSTAAFFAVASRYRAIGFFNPALR